jgi:hypothetical protein
LSLWAPLFFNTRLHRIDASDVMNNIALEGPMGCGLWIMDEHPMFPMTMLPALGELNNLETQQQLQLTSTTFDWLPTAGGFIRDLSYDILAPLAYYQLKEAQLVGEQRPILRLLYLSITQHNAIAKLDKLKYQPVTVNWRTDRYDDPSFHWLQGISETQLKERLRRFFTVLSISGSRRLGHQRGV